MDKLCSDIAKCGTIFWIILGLLLQFATGQQCDPTFQVLLNSNLIIGGVASLNCDVATCQSGYTLEWIKWTVTQNGQKDKELKVYSYTSDENQGAEETDDDYNIIGRTVYSNAFGYHTLSVGNLIIYDNGTWSCRAVYPGDVDNNIDEGDVIIPIKPQNTDVQISSKTMYIVEDDITEFECSVDKVNPQPRVTWAVDDKGGLQGDTHDVINEGYWSVINKILLPFPQVGDVVVKCALRNETDEFVSNTMQVDVKAKARMEYPTEPVIVSSVFNTSFLLNCSSSGYSPTLKWRYGNHVISESEKLYDITKNETGGYATSSLTSQLLTDHITCDSVVTYEGDYSCMVTLKGPYNHSDDISSDIKVNIEYPPIADNGSSLRVGKDMKDVVVTCHICASEPVLSDDWIFPETENAEKLENGSLKIASISEDSLTNYTRTVTNGLGTSSCMVTLIHDVDLDVNKLPPGAIAGIVIAVLVVICVPIVIFLFITYKKKKQKADEEVVAYAESGNTTNGSTAANGATTDSTNSSQPDYSVVNKDRNKKSLKDNSAGPVYTEVNKNTKKAQNKEDPAGPVYSQVNKPGRPLPHMKPKPGSTNTGPIYSEVSKPKQGRLTPIEKQALSGGGGEYEAVGSRPLPSITNARHYDNSGKRNEHGGIHYADVDFLRQGNGTKQSHGTRNPAYEPTEYAQIDHRKSAGIVV